jgi:hypothetical protein
MDRVDFTRKIAMLIIEMDRQEENPIIDFCKRSDEEQMRLYRIGRDGNGNKIGKTVTDCDGINIESAHQSGKAVDILFLNDERNKLASPKKGYDYWHQVWENWGGKPMIEWDGGHFE